MPDILFAGCVVLYCANGGVVYLEVQYAEAVASMLVQQPESINGRGCIDAVGGFPIETVAGFGVQVVGTVIAHRESYGGKAVASFLVP